MPNRFLIGTPSSDRFDPGKEGESGLSSRSLITIWDRALIVLMFVAAGLSFFLVPKVLGAGGKPEYIRISAGGNETRLPLDGNREFQAKAGGGMCLVEIRDRQVRVKAADCPKNLCVSQGWIDGAGKPIVCLPHRLTVSLEASGRRAGLDAVVR